MKYLVLGLLSLSAIADECSRYTNDCEYYLCISAEKGCDRRDYPVRFGHRFCLRYSKRIESFSEEGKIWVDNVRSCLIKKMEELDQELNCSQLKVQAFKTHVPCYLESGFCQLKLKDKRAVIDTVWPTIRNVYVLAGGINILKSCH